MNYKQLEKQLENLRKELGYRFCVVVGSLHEGYSLGVYDGKGELMYETQGVDVQTCKVKFQEWKQEQVTKQLNGENKPDIKRISEE